MVEATDLVLPSCSSSLAREDRSRSESSQSCPSRSCFIREMKSAQCQIRNTKTPTTKREQQDSNKARQGHSTPLNELIALLRLLAFLLPVLKT